VDASSSRVPPWVDATAPPRLWIDVINGLPWLKPPPYLVESDRQDEARTGLAAMGFSIVEAMFTGTPENAEESLLVELTRRLRFDEAGAGSWAAFNDRLWDFLSSQETEAVAVVIGGLDQLIESSIHGLLRCVHTLLSLTEGVGLANSSASRQIEYFFVGRWERT